MVDQRGAIAMFVDRQRVFIDQNHPKWVVLHKTAGGSSAQNIAHFFATDPNMASTHYIVGQDGAVVQAVLEGDGAAGNCCLEAGHAPFLPTDINLNLVTISIEHVDPATDNSTPLTDRQCASSFQLIRDICTRHGIPMKPGDASGGIIGHNQIDPMSRERCPGNYPWNDLWAFFAGQKGSVSMATPDGWHDDGTTLTAPNGHKVIKGFRDYILAHDWDPGNQPLEDEKGVAQLEMNNPSLGAGTRQIFTTVTLEWDEKRDVQVMYVGKELLYLYALVAQLRTQQTASDYQQIAQLQAQVQMLLLREKQAISVLMGPQQ